MDNQTITIIDRSTISITHAKNVISFDANEFLIDTPFGNLKICGKNLAIEKMETEKENLVVKGQIDNISYVSVKSIKDNKKESIFTKIFK